MKKWIIKYNSGNGDYAAVVEAETEAKATDMAYEAAREDFENCAEYCAVPYTEEEAADCGAE